MFCEQDRIIKNRFEANKKVEICTMKQRVSRGSPFKQNLKINLLFIIVFFLGWIQMLVGSYQFQFSLNKIQFKRFD